MRIDVDEVVKLAAAFQEVAQTARGIEREKANGIIQDEQHKLRAKVMQLCEALIAQGRPEVAVQIRDMLDDRPDPASDPDTSKRFPSMFRGGPV